MPFTRLLHGPRFGLSRRFPLHYTPIMRSSKRPQSTKLAEVSRQGTNAGQRTGKGTAGKRVQPTRAPKGKDRLFTLDVFLISGPISAKFARKNRTISRTIQMRAGHTLEDLHVAIFAAFDRGEEHMYEFQVGGEGPMDPKARKYCLSIPGDPFADETPAGDISKTLIGSLGLKVGDVFGYWFDFGDDWWHQINVVAIADEVPPGKYPKVTARVGNSPPQYPEGAEEG